MNFTRLTLVCALTSTLAACGGGNDSTANGAGAIAPEHGRMLTGIGSKGLIKDGLVKVYAYDTDGNRSSSPIATTRTSKNDGGYSIDLGTRTGLFLVEIGADASTTMDDEYSGTIAMPSGMIMRGLVQLDANSTSTVNGYVTPFTDMLVTAAMSAGPAGSLTEANVAAAQVEVTKILGFNPLTTRPLNSNSDAVADTDDAAEKLQAVALASISQIAHNNGLGCAGSDSEKVKCAVTATTGSATMKDGTVSIADAAKEALWSGVTEVAQDPVVNKTTLKTMSGQKLFADLASPTQTSGKTPASAARPAVLTPSAEAKAFFASLRSNLQAWSDSNKNGGLRNSLDTMKADFDNAVAPLDESLADWVVVSGRGIKLFNNFVEHKSTAIAADDGSDESALGSCKLYVDDAAQIPMTASDVGRVAPKSVSCMLTKKTIAYSERPVGGNLYNRDQITKVITLVPTGATSFSYLSRTQREIQEYKKNQQGTSYDFNTPSAKATIGGSAAGTVAYTMNGSAVSAATISGYMPARADESGNAITDREAWSVNYASTGEANGVDKYTLSGSIAAQKNGSSLGTVTLRNTSYVRAATVKGNYRIIEAKLDAAITAGSSTADGALYLGQFDTDKHGNRYAPTRVQFNGNFTNTRGESFKGAITVEATNYKKMDSVAPLSSNNFATGNVAFSGTLKIRERPALAVTFAARSTGYKADEFNGTYIDGTNFITFDGNNKLPRTINIASGTGIKVKFVEGAQFLDVFKNNTKAALLNLSTHTINYVDGSFETFN